MTITSTLKDAPLLAKWLRDGRKIAVWKSVNLSNPAAQWMTPGDCDRPSWQAASTPTLVEDPTLVVLRDEVEVKRFHVALRRSTNGLTIKLTDHSSKRVRKELDSLGPEAAYHFDYETQGCVITMPGRGTVTLARWMEDNP